MAKALSIDHLAIYFSDLKEARRFFVEGLGLELTNDYGGEIFLKIGDQQLALFKGTLKEQSINHLALSVDDFEGTKKRLEDLDYRIYKQDMVDGPNGIRIQLVF